MPGPTGPSPRSIGFALATLMAIVFAVIIWRSMGTTTAQPNQTNLFPTDPADIPDLSDLEQGDSMFVTIVDREDPTRIAGTLQADQFEPIGGGQRRLVNPDAWIFMRDGRRIHITANDGIVMMPDPNQAPESGTLKGNVTIESFDATTDPADPLSAAMGITPAQHQTPSMTAKFDHPVEFERRYQRLTSDGRFTIDSPGLEFIGHNLTVMLNEVKGRIELIDVRRGERLVLRPNAKQPNPTSSTPTTRNPAQPYTIRTVAQSSQPNQSTSPQNPPKAKDSTEPKKKAPYHIEFKDQVLVNMPGSGTLNAQNLDIWAVLTDGALSPNAIKEINFSSQDATAQPVPTSTPISSPAPTPEVSPMARSDQGSPPSNPSAIAKPRQSAPIQSPTQNEIIITWSGPLTVRPIEDPATTPLATDEIALAFTSQDRVTFNTLQGIQASADQIRYGATTANLELIGTDLTPVQITADQAGTLHAASLNANLDSGLISINSPGQLESAQTPAEPTARIHWSTAAQFALQTSETGELIARLKSANFQGQVLGSRADAVVQSHSLKAEFDDQGPPQTALRTITLSRGALTSDSGSLNADDLSIRFSPIYDASGVTPSTLDATGDVLAVSPDGRIQTDSLNAVLVREYDGQTRIQTATAQGNTEFLGQRETHAAGQRLDLNTDHNTIHIVGNASTPATAGQAGSTIQGPDIRINTRSRSIQVQGKGTFDHDILVKDAPTGGRLKVTWNDSMRFDHALGSIECTGNVVAVSTPDAYTIDTLKADRLEIDLTPAPGTHDLDTPAQSIEHNDAQRELYQARAYGRAVPGADPIPASVESRTYDPNNPERATGVMYIQASQLIADNRNQTLRIPTQGMMVLMDRSNDQPGGQSGDSATVMPNTSGPGLTRMTWLGSMELDRAKGTAKVLNEVNIRHKSLTTGKVSQLGCDELNAEFSPSNPSDPSAPITMHRADASGRVRFTDLQRTLLSDHAIYDAINETLFAFADDNRLVTLRDSANPTPVSARTLLWDLKKDLVEIDAPSPVRAPARP